MTSSHPTSQGRSRLGATLSALVASAALLLPYAAQAHDFTVGAIAIAHPYALPTPDGVSVGAAYLKQVRNSAAQADRLVGASTPRAARVSLHRLIRDGDVVRMRETDAIELPAKSTVLLQHGASASHHLMLEGLQAPLRKGERFDLTLRFENAGEKTVKVWVQEARERTAHQH